MKLMVTFQAVIARSRRRRGKPEALFSDWFASASARNDGFFHHNLGIFFYKEELYPFDDSHP